MTAAAKTKDGKALTMAPEGGLPTFLADKAAQDVGKGVSDAQEDNLVPLVYVLQAQSPQCNKRSPEYVEGAEAGAIWLRNSGRAAINGEIGILFQPCHFSKDWVEWIPRAAGGGFAGRHDERPEAAVETPDEKNPRKINHVLPGGNTVSETRYHVGYVYFEDGSCLPYVIPMSSSAHTVSRQWMFMMNSKSLPGVSGAAPSWAALYRLRTKERTNAAGTWATWDITDAGWVRTPEEYERGRRLFESFETGERKVATPDEALTEETGDSDTAAM